MTKLFICTDLDRTLIPNGPQSESTSARAYFKHLVSDERVTLAYVTGRDLSLVRQAIKNYGIPIPDYVIADVGSSIYKMNASQWLKMDAWDKEISQDWNGKSNKDIQGILKEVSDIRLQEYNKQKDRKLSYYVPLYIDQTTKLHELHTILDAHNINVNMIWSIDVAANIGLLDILPASANKKHAIEYLMNLLNFNLDETIFAGDSGNDISVMASNIHSILVANASDSVKTSALQHAKQNGEFDSLYVAKGQFYGMNGNYSAGILEGIAHYIPESILWMGINND